ncbi:MAG: hypothetical protein U9R19_01130 [Bacteroidota bacterium]|nr:hypothetical protein [Bacteroidota bacterium]
MGAIHIYSNKTDDLYFLNELARRMNLKTDIETPENNTSGAKVKNNSIKEDDKLAELAFLTSGVTLEKFFEEEIEKMF